MNLAVLVSLVDGKILLHAYVYIFICMCVCIYIYIYIYILYASRHPAALLMAIGLHLEGLRVRGSSFDALGLHFRGSGAQFGGFGDLFWRSWDDFGGFEGQ